MELFVDEGAVQGSPVSVTYGLFEGPTEGYPTIYQLGQYSLESEGDGR